jgi:predicted transcriptional regulator
MTRKVSIKLTEMAIKEKWIRHLAFYHLLKKEFFNSCIYDYRHRMKEIAGRLNVSEKTLYNHLNFLRGKGLVSDHSTNLKICSIRPFLTRRKTIIEVSGTNTLFDIECLLYGKIIEKKARGMAFKESLRRFGTGDGFKRKLGENPFRPSLSFRSIAKILNVSEYKAVKVMKNLTKLGVIEFEKQPPKLISKGYFPLGCVEDMPGYRYTIGNRVYEQWGNLISFLQFPIFLKKLTIQQYKKFTANVL